MHARQTLAQMWQNVLALSSAREGERFVVLDAIEPASTDFSGVLGQFDFIRHCGFADERGH